MSNIQIIKSHSLKSDKSSNNYKKSSTIIGNYEIIKTIGEGTFGKVKLAKNIPSNELVAIKILEKTKISDDEDLSCIKNEIKFLKKLNHPNIISLYEIIETKTHYFIVMEYAEKDLFSYIVSNHFLNENEASYFYIQILFVIEYIHNNHIVHRDLKPENILLTNNNSLLKIIDFGLANKYEENNLLDTQCGSLCYSAPEMILGKKYNGIDIDIWSSGIILFAMVSGFLPFDDDNEENIYRKVVEGKYCLPEKLSDNCKDLINKILVVEPENRIKINDIKKHPFLKNAYQKFNKEFFKKYKQNIYKTLNFKEEEKNIEIYDLIVDKMMKMKIKGINNSDIIIKNIKENNFNEITAIYKLLLKKYNRNKLLYSANTTSVSTKKLKLNQDSLILNPNIDKNNKHENNLSNPNSNHYINKKKINATIQINGYNHHIYKTNHNSSTKDREIISYKTKNNFDSFKLNSYSIENQNISNYFKNNKKRLNKISKKKIENELNCTIKKTKNNKNLIQKYINLMKSIKNSMINRNIKKMTDLSISFEKKNNLIFFPIKKKIITSSIPNLTDTKLSFMNSSSIELKEKKNKNSYKNTSKIHKKKSLSIITSSNLNLDHHFNINLHKRVISGMHSSNHNSDSKYKNITNKVNKKKPNFINYQNKSKRRTKSKENNMNFNININSYRSSNIVNKIKDKMNQNKTVIQRYNNYFTESEVSSSFNINFVHNLFKKKFIKNKKTTKLNTIFINLSKNSNSKSPNKSINNLSNISLNNKNMKPNKDFTKLNKNSSPPLKSKVVFTINNKKNEFSCCSSFYSLTQIIKKLQKLCYEKKYKFKNKDNNRFYILYKENIITIEVTNISDRIVLKIFHNNSNEKICKDIINNIILKVGY